MKRLFGVKTTRLAKNLRWAPKRLLSRRRSSGRARADALGVFAGMNNAVRIALDAMGGDSGPSVVVPAAAIALVRRPDVSFTLYGDEKLIRPILDAHPALARKTQVVHSDVSIKMTDKPSQALRAGRRSSSMWQAIDAVKKGEADFVVSAGNTGALMAMAKVCLRTMPQIDPPWRIAARCNAADAAEVRVLDRARCRRHHRRRRPTSDRPGDHGRSDGAHHI